METVAQLSVEVTLLPSTERYPPLPTSMTGPEAEPTGFERMVKPLMLDEPATIIALLPLGAMMLGLLPVPQRFIFFG